MPSTILPDNTPAVGRYRWLVCALLFFATTINYIDRQILALLKPMLDEQLHWTNEQFGMVNAFFQGAYGIGLLFFGWFVDRFGAKIGYGVSIAAWSLAAAGHALVATVSGFAIARVALGLGEGGNFPAAVKVVAHWFPKNERAFATSLFNSGSNVGAIIAPALVPAIAYAWGWQMAFIIAGAAGFVWLVFWLRCYDAPEDSTKLGAAERAYIAQDGQDVGPVGKAKWRDVLRHREAWAFVVAKLLTDPVWWFLLIWLPDYFKQTRGMDLKKSWVHLVTIYAIITVLSIVGTWLTGKLLKRGWSVTKARKTGMFLFAVFVVPVFAVTHVDVWFAVALIGLAGAAHQAWSATLFTSVSDIFPKRAVASIIGIGGLAGALGGMAFPPLTGRLLDAFKAEGDVTGGYSVLFTICAFAYLVTFALHHLLAPKFEPLNARFGSK